MKRSILASAVLCCAMLTGCSSDNDASSSNSYDITGAFSVDAGYSVPVNGEISVIWQISSASPDYTYVSPGVIRDTAFAVELPIALQQEAVNSYGVAVGVMTVFPAGAAPAPGVVSADVELNTPAGISENHAVIYKTADANDEILGWSSEFSTGYSCGLVQRAENDNSFDSFTPVSCNEVIIRVGDIDTFDPIDWT